MDGLLDYLTVANGRSGNPSRAGGGSGNVRAEHGHSSGISDGFSQ